MSNELVVVEGGLQVVANNHDLAVRYQTIQDAKSIMKEGVHYGQPYQGAGKPTLLKPGAEWLTAMFGLWPEYTALTLKEDFDKPLFYYRYECKLRTYEGRIVGSGIGSCNSMEDKYGWRWVPEHEVPEHLDKSDLMSRTSSVAEFAFAIEKAETTGKYGKPAEYWQRFQEAIKDGSAHKFQKTTGKGSKYPAWEIKTTVYRIPNPDIFSIVNTLDKMAQKRAFIAAVLQATGASAEFTQDVEDFTDYSGHIIEGEFSHDKPRRVDAETGEITTPPEPEKHWTEEQDWKAFWRVVKNDLLLTEEQAHEALGVDSAKDFEGSKVEAFDKLKEAAAQVAKAKREEKIKEIEQPDQDNEPDSELDSTFPRTYDEIMHSSKKGVVDLFNGENATARTVSKSAVKALAAELGFDVDHLTLSNNRKVLEGVAIQVMQDGALKVIKGGE